MADVKETELVLLLSITKLMICCKLPFVLKAGNIGVSQGGVELLSASRKDLLYERADMLTRRIIVFLS